ncbi:pyridoxal phosphate-dependent decarboxylase family protein [Thalassiella azotivora]
MTLPADLLGDHDAVPERVVDVRDGDAEDTTDLRHLLTTDSAERYRHLVRKAVDRVADQVATVDRPFTGVTPAQLAPVVDGVDLDSPLGSTTAALDELSEVYLRDAVWFHHPRYLAHLNCPVAIPALVAEAVVSSVNSSLDTWDQSAGGTLIERRLVDWTTRRIGFGPEADGVFTSGGTQSNLQALHLARDEALHRGVPVERLRVLASEVSHFSVRKSAHLLGLGPDAVVEVPCDPGMRMRPDALAEAIERCRHAGLVPMAVVATAGTTDYASIDPLPEVADVCARTGTWLHVDAAYGCGLLASRRRRHLLDGIERADSVTVDFHKSFFQPVSSSAVLVRDGSTLRHVTYHADYLNPKAAAVGGTPNQVDKSLQTTRRFDALKLWMTFRVMGADAVGRLFDQAVDRAEDAWRMLVHDPRFEVVTRPQLSTVVFRVVPDAPAGHHLPDDVLDDVQQHVREAIAASGEAVVAGTRRRGRRYLKLTLLNPATTVEDLAAVFELVAHLAHHRVEHLAATGALPRSGDDDLVAAR